MDIKVIISIKYVWNAIVRVQIRHLSCFAQNLLAVKVHTSSKISKFYKLWGPKNPHGQNFCNLIFLSEKTKLWV